VTRPLAIVVLAGLAACGPALPPLMATPERERRELSESEIEAIGTILRLEDHRDYDARAFGTLLGDPSDEVRRRAATAAGRIGDPDAVAALVDLLGREPRPAVRADAVFAIGLLGDTSALVLDALRAAAPRDLVPVRPEETTVVVEVMAALGRLGSDRARSDLVDALRRTHGATDPHSRRIAAEALLAIWKFPTGAGRVVSAVRYLDHPDPELRWRAALALVRLGEHEAAGPLLGVIGDGDARVRALAARGLTAAMADGAGIDATALASLQTTMRDGHPHVRINAARSIATFADRAPVESLAELLLDRDPNVAIAAAEALGAVGFPAAGILEAIIADERAAVPVRGAALGQLAAVAADQAVPLVTAWAEADRPRRYAAARALAPLGWVRAGALAGRLADDPDVRVAVAATEAAGAMAGADDLDAAGRAALRDLLIRLAAAGDPRQRVPALRGLPPLLDAGDVPALLDVYAAAEGRDEARPAALAAIRALGSLQAAGIPAAAPFFDRFAHPGDRWLARAAAESLGDRWGPPPAAVAADDTAFYVGVVRALVAPVLATGRRPVATIRTTHGEIRLELLPEEAPLTVYNFIRLANAGFYDDGVWHRVVPNFVLQDGAPAGDPLGGPGWTIRDEINRVRYLRGILGMALAGPDTGGSQWFITHSPQPHLDGGYTVFGRVTGGERAMDRVVQGDDVVSVRVR
jgi:cyclophilin family peptidyl-prolyl cis-trans isomerase/HEAT repeat protein